MKKVFEIAKLIKSVYASNPGNRADCYAKLAVFFPCRITIVSAHCALREGHAFR